MVTHSMTYRRRDGDVSRFSFHWNPLSEPDRLDAVLATYDPPPSHIVFQNAFWFLAAGTDLYERNVTLMLDVFARRAPDAAIIIKTGSSVVQAQVRPRRRARGPRERAFLIAAIAGMLRADRRPALQRRSTQPRPRGGHRRLGGRAPRSRARHALRLRRHRFAVRSAPCCLLHSAAS
jgi:hypothetical protein